MLRHFSPVDQEIDRFVYFFVLRPCDVVSHEACRAGNISEDGQKMVGYLSFPFRGILNTLTSDEITACWLHPRSLAMFDITQSSPLGGVVVVGSEQLQLL